MLVKACVVARELNLALDKGKDKEEEEEETTSAQWVGDRYVGHVLNNRCLSGRVKGAPLTRPERPRGNDVLQVYDVMLKYITYCNTLFTWAWCYKMMQLLAAKPSAEVLAKNPLPEVGASIIDAHLCSIDWHV